MIDTPHPRHLSQEALCEASGAAHENRKSKCLKANDEAGFQSAVDG